jgi:uncharacterized PurR-regulated membrane protein YhhQ (DUF165 family)
MNWKRFWMAGLVTYVVVQALDLVTNEVFMKSANESLKGLWRPNMMSRMWVMYVVGAVVTLLFTYIFVKGREGKGIAEGVRYGIIIWLFVSVPMNVSMWVLLPIPHIIVLRWMLIGLLEMLIAGILVAVIYKPLAPAKS